MPAEYVDLPIYRDGLAAALGFNSTDLESNRAGRLSVSQRAWWFRQHVFPAVRIAAVCLLLAAGSVALAFVIGIGEPLSWMVLVLGALMLIPAGFGAVIAFQLSQALNAGLVSSIEGFVQPYVQETRVATAKGLPAMPIWTYYWIVGDQRFAVWGKAYAALTPARHRLYFLPQTRRVVAAEPVSDGH